MLHLTVTFFLITLILDLWTLTILFFLPFFLFTIVFDTFFTRKLYLGCICFLDLIHFNVTFFLITLIDLWILTDIYFFFTEIGLSNGYIKMQFFVNYLFKIYLDFYLLLSSIHVNSILNAYTRIYAC